MNRLLTLLLCAPLAACFEAVDPEIEPADLRDGAWDLHLTDISAFGDCGGIEAAGPIDAMAFFASDGEELSILMEGLLLEGFIEGASLSVTGGMDLSEPGHGGGGGETRPGECGDLPADAGDEDDGAAPPPCVAPEPEPEPGPDAVSVSIDARIFAEDLIRGSLVLEVGSGAAGCYLEAALVGLAVDEDGPRPQEPQEEPVEPYPGEEPEGDPTPMGD